MLLSVLHVFSIQCRYDAHTASLLTIQLFVSVLESEINPISQIQDQLLYNTISKSEKKSSIVKYTLLRGRHSVPLRGHRSDCGYKHCGNFEALPDFRFEIGDNSKHFKMT